MNDAVRSSGDQSADAGRAPDGFDAAALARLRQMLGDAKLRQLLEAARADVASSIAQIRESAARGDLGALAVGAHSLRGVSGTIGAARIRDCAARLETLARAGGETSAPLREVEAALPSLEAALDELAASLE